MEWLNYHHLLYFRAVVKAGGVAAAARELRLSPPTISTQIRLLEESFGEKLFQKAGRGLVLTETGHVVARYADEVFALGRELNDAVRDRPTGRPLRLSIGIADVLPKWVAYGLIQPALRLDQAVAIVCREGRADRLVAELAVHELDVLLSDTPLGSGVSVRVFNRTLVDCGTVFVAAPRVAAQYKRGFPASLRGAPLLYPSTASAIRGELDRWFDAEDIRPSIVGEFDDFALSRTFAEKGHGIVAAPAVIERVLLHEGFRVVGRLDAVRNRFYAVSVEKKIRHPGVAAMCGVRHPQRFG